MRNWNECENYQLWFKFLAIFYEWILIDDLLIFSNITTSKVFGGFQDHNLWQDFWLLHQIIYELGFHHCTFILNPCHHHQIMSSCYRLHAIKKPSSQKGLIKKIFLYKIQDEILKIDFLHNSDIFLCDSHLNKKFMQKRIFSALFDFIFSINNDFLLTHTGF